jgi:DNA-binding HxlR family transcriptional regulator
MEGLLQFKLKRRAFQHGAARLKSRYETVTRALSGDDRVKRDHVKLSPTLPVGRMVEDIVGCKWSLAVLGAVRSGVNRPGAMETAIDGVSKKVLNERLSKLVRFGILEKQAYPEIPPRVEYRLSAFGAKFCGVLDGIDALQREFGS